MSLDTCSPMFVHSPVVRANEAAWRARPSSCCTLGACWFPLLVRCLSVSIAFLVTSCDLPLIVMDTSVGNEWFVLVFRSCAHVVHCCSIFKVLSHPGRVANSTERAVMGEQQKRA